MLFTRSSSLRSMAGQNDVQSALHIPMVYESVQTSLPQWEYHLVTVDTREAAPLEASALNEYGQQGWLLGSVLEERLSEKGTRIYYYFVRQRQA